MDTRICTGCGNTYSFGLVCTQCWALLTVPQRLDLRRLVMADHPDDPDLAGIRAQAGQLVKAAQQTRANAAPSA